MDCKGDLAKREEQQEDDDLVHKQRLPRRAESFKPAELRT